MVLEKAFILEERAPVQVLFLNDSPWSFLIGLFCDAWGCWREFLAIYIRHCLIFPEVDFAFLQCDM